MSEPDIQESKNTESDSGKTAIWITIIIVMMIMFATADWPSGNKTTVTGFIFFWLRELLILGLFLGMLIFKVFSTNKNDTKPKKSSAPETSKLSDTN